MKDNVNFGEYIEQVVNKTESKIDGVMVNRMVLQSAVGVAMAAIEILDQLKKHIFYVKKDDAGNLIRTRPVSAEAVREQIEAIDLFLGDLQGSLYDVNNVDEDELIEVDARLLHGVLGKVTEGGEMLLALTPAITEGVDIDLVNLSEEMGDDQWYNGVILDVLHQNIGTTLSSLLVQNGNKLLKGRYKGGTFNADEAANRDLNTERQILEAGNGG